MAAANTKRRQALARERKKVESELVKQGKTPYFLKNCKSSSTLKKDTDHTYFSFF
jgi:hypothetical protein